jgi:hypothetical protein
MTFTSLTSSHPVKVQFYTFIPGDTAAYLRNDMFLEEIGNRLAFISEHQNGYK